MLTADIQEVAKYVQSLMGTLAFDIETTGLNPRVNKLVAIQFMQEKEEPFIIDCRTLDMNKLGDVIAPLFDGNTLILGHNLKFDTGFLLSNFGIRADRIFDCFIAEKVIYSADETIEYNLAALVDRYRVRLKYEMNKEDRKYFIDMDTRDDWFYPFPEQQIRYMQQDVQCLFPIYKAQLKSLKELKLVNTAKLEMQVVPVIRELEGNGLKIYVPGWREEIKKHTDKCLELEDKIIGIVGPVLVERHSRDIDEQLASRKEWEAEKKKAEEEYKRIHSEGEFHPDFLDRKSNSWSHTKQVAISKWKERNPPPYKPTTFVLNINSNKQLLEAFDLLKIPIPYKEDKKTKLLKASLDKDCLKTLDEDVYPLVKFLKIYNQEKKFVASYGESLLAEIDPVTNRFHFSYNQIVSTGRMSASRIQQIPKKGDGQLLRNQVIPEEGSVLITSDYPAIEMRIAAVISKEESLMDTFREGRDIHSDIARMIFKLGEDADPKKVIPKGLDKSCREISKTVEYATLYGAGVGVLSKNIGCSPQAARRIRDDFCDSYSRLKNFTDYVKKQVVTSGETRTMGGRARFYRVPSRPLVKHSDYDYKDLKKQYETSIASIQSAASNAPIQGTSADITKGALVRYYSWIKENKLFDQVKVVAAVHDEIVAEAKKEVAELAAKALSRCMSEAAAIFLKDVPCPCEYTIADHWSKD